MTRLMRMLLIGLIASLLAVLVVIDVDAAGLSVGPARIEETDAFRGDEYQETIYVKHLGESDCLILLSATGDIGEWVSFYELDDPTTSIETTIASPGEWTYVLVKLTVPDDAPIGTVAGTIKVNTAPPPDENGVGTTVALTGKVDVRVDVVTAVGGAGGTIGPALRNTIIGVVAGIAALAVFFIWFDISRRKKAYVRQSRHTTGQRESVTSVRQKSTPKPRSRQRL